MQSGIVWNGNKQAQVGGGSLHVYIRISSSSLLPHQDTSTIRDLQTKHLNLSTYSNSNSSTCLTLGEHLSCPVIYSDTNSHTRRKGLGDQVAEKATPQSQKTYTQVASENVSGAYDKVAGAVQPSRSIGLYQVDSR